MSESKVQSALNALGFSFTVQTMPSSTHTARDAAKTIGCEVGQIIKSLLFCTKENQEPVLILVSGINRVNEKMLTQHIGDKIVKANADFAREVTGYAIGGIPPLGHQNAIQHIYIDEDLLNYNVLWAAAGTPFSVFQLYANDLQKMTHGKIVAVH